MNAKHYSRTFELFLMAILSSCVPKVESKFESPKAPNLGNDPQKIIENAMDITALGGQPGRIELNGIIGKLAMISAGADSALFVSAKPGIGWRGAAPKLESASAPVFSEVVSDDAKKSVNTQFKIQYLSFGCSEQQQRDQFGNVNTASPIIDKQTFNDSMKFVSAEHVMICGNDPLSASVLISVTAKELILRDVAMKVTAISGLDIQASKLTCYGANSISTVAQDGPSTATAGPSMTISITDKLELDGSLAITAIGSSYKK